MKDVKFTSVLPVALSSATLIPLTPQASLAVGSHAGGCCNGTAFEPNPSLSEIHGDHSIFEKRHAKVSIDHDVGAEDHPGRFDTGVI